MSRFMMGVTSVCIVILGLVLRSHVNFAGDFLWAALIYLMFSFCFIRLSFQYKFWIPLLICYAVEATQLYHAPWIDSLRQNSFLQLVLGHGVFGFTDILAYTLAIMIVSGMDRLVARTRK